jgi:hypothetical protein
MYGYRQQDVRRSEAVSGDWRRVERETRAPLSIEGALIVPVMASLALGLASTLVVSGVALGAGSEWRSWLAWSVAILGLVWSVGLVWLLTASFEHFTSWEVYEGGSEDRQEQERQVLRLEVVDPARGRLQFSEDLPVDRERFLSFARSVEARGLSTSAWCGSGALFSRSEFDALTGYLTQAGLVRWLNADAHNQGRELTPAGQATLRRFVEHSEHVLEA